MFHTIFLWVYTALNVLGPKYLLDLNAPHDGSGHLEVIRGHFQKPNHLSLLLPTCGTNFLNT